VPGREFGSPLVEVLAERLAVAVETAGPQHDRSDHPLRCGLQRAEHERSADTHADDVEPVHAKLVE